MTDEVNSQQKNTAYIYTEECKSLISRKTFCDRQGEQIHDWWKLEIWYRKEKAKKICHHWKANVVRWHTSKWIPASHICL